MEVYYNGENKKLEKLIREPLFLKVAAYLEEHQEREIILRELEKQLSNPNLERIIEKMVEYGVIERKDRRYRLLTPYIKNWPETFPFSSFDSSSEGHVIQLLERLEAELPRECFFLTDLAFPTRTILENKHLQLITVGKDLSVATLPNYFYGKKQSVDDLYPDLTALLGDVEEGYFCDQVEVIFEKIETGKLRLKRRNIFYDALVLTSVVSKEQQIIIPKFVKETKQEEISQQLDPIQQTLSIQQQILGLLSSFTGNTITYYKTK